MWGTYQQGISDISFFSQRHGSEHPAFLLSHSLSGKSACCETAVAEITISRMFFFSYKFHVSHPLLFLGMSFLRFKWPCYFFWAKTDGGCDRVSLRRSVPDLAPALFSPPTKPQPPPPQRSSRSTPPRSHRKHLQTNQSSSPPPAVVTTYLPQQKGKQVITREMQQPETR